MRGRKKRGEESDQKGPSKGQTEVERERGKGCPRDNEDWSACRLRKDI